MIFFATIRSKLIISNWISQMLLKIKNKQSRPQFQEHFCYLYYVNSQGNQVIPVSEETHDHYTHGHAGRGRGRRGAKKRRKKEGEKRTDGIFARFFSSFKFHPNYYMARPI